MPGFFELISLEETKRPQPQKSHGPISVCFFQEINKQELEVAHAGDLYDKAHGDSMRAEKALKATFQGGRTSRSQKSWKCARITWWP